MRHLPLTFAYCSVRLARVNEGVRALPLRRVAQDATCDDSRVHLREPQAPELMLSRHLVMLSRSRSAAFCGTMIYASVEPAIRVTCLTMFNYLILLY